MYASDQTPNATSMSMDAIAKRAGAGGMRLDVSNVIGASLQFLRLVDDRLPKLRCRPVQHCGGSSVGSRIVRYTSLVSVDVVVKNVVASKTLTWGRVCYMVVTVSSVRPTAAIVRNVSG
jgi:hypothetical protein